MENVTETISSTEGVTETNVYSTEGVTETDVYSTEGVTETDVYSTEGVTETDVYSMEGVTETMTGDTLQALQDRFVNPPEPRTEEELQVRCGVVW